MLVPRKGGFKIKLENGKILPKIYPTREAGNKRISQLKKHGRVHF